MWSCALSRCPAVRSARSSGPCCAAPIGRARSAASAAPDTETEEQRMAHIAYTKGLHELGDDLRAYLQPDGGYGWSNAGLISSGDVSILVDTLFDLACTRDMLDAMAPVLDTKPIGSLI